MYVSVFNYFFFIRVFYKYVNDWKCCKYVFKEISILIENDYRIVVWFYLIRYDEFDIRLYKNISVR